MTFEEVVANARLRGPGPYIARPAKDNDYSWPYWYVAGPNGRLNVLYWPGGKVLCCRETAEEIARIANLNYK